MYILFYIQTTFDKFNSMSLSHHYGVHQYIQSYIDIFFSLVLKVTCSSCTPKAKTPKVNNFKWLHKAGGGLITLIRDNLTCITTDISSTINTHNTELQMVKAHINNTKHITIANIYIPPRDSTSMHYKSADTDIQHCIQHITNIPQLSPPRRCKRTLHFMAFVH